MSLAISCRDLVVSRAGRRVLGPLDADFTKGAITAICGANGSGKTTLLNTLIGQLTPDQGTVFLDDQPLAATQGRARGRSIAVLRQHQENVAGLTLRELVGFGRFPHRGLLGRQSAADWAAVDRAIAMCGLQALAGRDMQALSGGEQQRAWLALALAQEPQILMLDEPTSYLDVRYQVEILSLLRRLNREAGLTIIAVLHDLDQVMHLADAVLLLCAGRVVAAGETGATMTTQNLRAVYDLPIEVVPNTAPPQATAQGEKPRRDPPGRLRIDWLGADR